MNIFLMFERNWGFLKDLEGEFIVDGVWICVIRFFEFKGFVEER